MSCGFSCLSNMKDFIINEKSEKLIELYNQGNWRAVLELLEGDFYDQRYLWVRPTLDNLAFIGSQVGATTLVSVGCGCALLEWLIVKATGVDVIGLEVDRLWWESGYAPPTFLPLHFADEITTSNQGPEVDNIHLGSGSGNETTNQTKLLNGATNTDVTPRSLVNTDSIILQINRDKNGTNSLINGSNAHINDTNSLTNVQINDNNTNTQSITTHSQINGCKADCKTTLLFCYFNNRPAFESYVSCYEGSCIIIIGPAKGQGAHTDPEPFDAKLCSDWSITTSTLMPITGDHIVVYKR